MDDDVIHIKSDALRALAEKLYAHICEKYMINGYKYVPTEEAMKMLGISSKATLQKLRDEGKIVYSQHMTKVIMYSVESINEYLDKHAKNTF